jgi:hypothetical protein
MGQFPLCNVGMSWKVIIFWDVAPCSFVESDCSFMALCRELIGVPLLAVICR